MKFRLFILFVFGSLPSFAQSGVLVEAPEGVYASFDDFLQRKPSLSIEIVEQNTIKNQFGNIIVVPDKLFSNMRFIMIKGSLYVRRTAKMRSSDLPIAIVPLNGAVITVSKLDVAFVRLIKFGSISLNAENDMLKLPSIENYRLSKSNFKYLIKDDKELTMAFKKERDKEIGVHRYIDLYNLKHPLSSESIE